MKDTATMNPAKTLFGRFQLELANIKGDAVMTKPADLISTTTMLLERIKARKLAVYYSPLLRDWRTEGVFSVEKFSMEDVYELEETPPADFDPQTHRDRLAGSDVAITTADYLLADTGTIAFRGHSQPSKLVTILSPALIILARMEQIYPDIRALHAHLESEGSSTASSIAYYTGPSRTADIEKTLVLGVHGPKELFVVVVE